MSLTSGDRVKQRFRSLQLGSAFARRNDFSRSRSANLMSEFDDLEPFCRIEVLFSGSEIANRDAIMPATSWVHPKESHEHNA